MAKDRGTPKPATGKSSALSKVSLPQWIALGLTVLAVVFIVQNRTTVRIDLFWVSVESPLWFILAVVFLVGWVVGVLAARGRYRQRRPH
ncbi:MULTISPECIES: lipopolysaccharide assembly protein LapA domain-containing protein [Gordonia]|uniref:lipopolysaccharide assembly protein LapA domain-containing protein n=1 Tax=Gordonia TaxID=2053 RepID=UPI0010F5D699|nr:MULTISPECIES: LapA family protein [unclassified Gordonia (in: high G+C Gram-positive bacteria)]MBN0973408.1 LapA family protein [Gordonia sp. BP-119]MBN0985528.1 LapA family protein [Gordonia sp. BP-94]MCT1352879.1 LapA family protein [Gordonia sp. p3-SID1431]UCZ88223.1 LapA family protein [Gordonia sp. WA4-43]